MVCCITGVREKLLCGWVGGLSCECGEKWCLNLVVVTGLERVGDGGAKREIPGLEVGEFEFLPLDNCKVLAIGKLLVLVLDVLLECNCMRETEISSLYARGHFSFESYSPAIK